MLNIPKKLSTLTEIQLQWLFTALSALLAWRVIYIQHGWINDDSVLYFEVARLFSIGEWKQGITLYNWPLYPAIITFIHKFTGFEFQRAAQILDVAFFALTTYSFVTLIRLAGGNKCIIAYGALLLFSTLYIVGDVLPMLLRDQGFWAFFLISIVFFIQFYRLKKLQTALIWQIAAIIAVLFRIEAITFLFFLPLILLTEKKPDRIKAWVYANSLSLLAFFIIVLVLFLHPRTSLTDFGRLNDLYTVSHNVYTNMTQGITQKAQMMGEQVLGSFLDQYGMTGVVVTLFAILCIKCIAAPGWIATLILAVNWRNIETQLLPDARKIFYWVIVLAIFNAAVILISTFILSGRYVVSLGFIMLILAAFCLSSHIEGSNKTHPKRILLVLIFLVIGFSLINNILPKKDGYNFEQDAVTYIKKLQKPNERVFYVSPRARYYAGQPFSSRGYDFEEYTAKAIADGSIQHYDYLAINITSNPEQEKKLKATLVNYQLIKEIMGPRSKKKVMIFAKKE